MRILGVDAELTGGKVNLQLPGPRTTIPCFEAPAGGEVVVGGRKLIGSAMRAHGGSILQHGAILLDWDSRLQAGAMGLRDDSSLRPHITTLADELGPLPDRGILEKTVVRGLTDEFGVNFDHGTMAEHEAARETQLTASFSVND